jgi:hypothetical protein
MMRKIRQVSQYDKIFKENIEAALPVLLDKILHIQPVITEEIPDDLQITMERKPDFLKKITDTTNKTFILHVEFQLADEAEMVYRMCEYYAILLRKYKLPVHQYVFFLADSQPVMAVNLEEENLFFRFNLITFNRLDYQVFINSAEPEAILLALLGDFGNDSPKKAVENIIAKLAKQSKKSSDFERHMQQLRILANLRSLQPLTEKLMESITKYFKEENDFLFQKGELKGKLEGELEGELKERQKNTYMFISNLLRETDFSDEKIASLAGAGLKQVQEVRAEMEKKN